MANPKVLPANFSKRISPHFKKILSWPKGAKIFCKPSSSPPSRGKITLDSVKADFEVWALLFPAP